VIPGLPSLRSLTRGYSLPPLRGSLSYTTQVDSLIAWKKNDAVRTNQLQTLSE
jgi:hypothetical protein